MERMKALENGETIEAKCKSSVDANVQDGGVATTALTASVLSSLLLPLFM